jgi:hypothetical protein
VEWVVVFSPPSSRFHPLFFSRAALQKFPKLVDFNQEEKKQRNRELDPRFRESWGDYTV